MGLFARKRNEWWAENHAPSNSELSEVEHTLHDNWLDYRYDDSYDRICVAVKHYGENTHSIFAAVTCPDRHRILITTYNGMFNVQPEGKEELLSLLERVNANSEYLNLDVDSKTSAIVSTCVLDEKTPDARIYILPILMEQARILDEYYDDMAGTHGKKMPRVFLDYMRYYELVKFAWIPINVIVKVGDKLAIIHEQSKNGLYDKIVGILHSKRPYMTK